MSLLQQIFRIDLQTIISRMLMVIIIIPFRGMIQAFVAYKLGDPTAKNQNKMSLNPLAHIDIVGAVFLVFIGFGWSSPLEINAGNFKKPKRDEGIVALCGPLANFLLALILVVIAKLCLLVPIRLFPILAHIFITMGLISIYLGLFDLLPIPQFDGFNILRMILPNNAFYKYQSFMYRVPSMVVILLVYFVFSLPFNIISQYMISAFDMLTFFIR